MEARTEELLLRFRDAAIGNADISDPKKASLCDDVGHACYRELRQTEEGRQGMIALMTDDNPYVRVCAAARSLCWAPEEARRVLEEIRDGDGPGAFTAKWTLIEYDKGRLTFDY
jgi:hypothetical protein